MFTPQQIIEFNQMVDIVHSYFPYIGFLACVFIIESHLPAQKVIGEQISRLEKRVLKIKLWAMILFSSTWFSQAFLGGCLVHIPQNALNQIYFGQPLHDFGLFYRESLPASYLPFLRSFYLFLFIYVTWRTVVFYQKYVASSINRTGDIYTSQKA
jgi:hypothetical protein